MNQPQTFTYTYSAAQQEEVAAIRRKYMADTACPEVDKMAQLRRLDAEVSARPARIALWLGTLSALVMGAGMSLVMTDLGEGLGILQPMLPGILVGLVGMAGVIAAYPLYRLVLGRARKKAAPRILALTDELLQ